MKVQSTSTKFDYRVQRSTSTKVQITKVISDTRVVINDNLIYFELLLTECSF